MRAASPSGLLAEVADVFHSDHLLYALVHQLGQGLGGADAEARRYLRRLSDLVADPAPVIDVGELGQAEAHRVDAVGLDAVEALCVSTS